MTGRFDDLKVGDQLMCDDMLPAVDRNGKFSNKPHRRYYLVTDLWFDPVRGQKRASSGRMAGVVWLDLRGEPIGDKRAHSLRGLASQKFYYADMDYAGMAGKRAEAMRTGEVIGIGRELPVRWDK